MSSPNFRAVLDEWHTCGNTKVTESTLAELWPRIGEVARTSQTPADRLLGIIVLLLTHRVDWLPEKAAVDGLRFLVLRFTSPGSDGIGRLQPLIPPKLEENQFFDTFEKVASAFSHATNNAERHTILTHAAGSRYGDLLGLIIDLYLSHTGNHLCKEPTDP